MAHEHVTIVDERDRPIGEKPIGDIKPDDIYRVSVLWLTNPRGDILFAQRGLHVSNSPGVWGTAAAGTLEQGETYEANMHKEAAEEIGLTGVTFQFGPKTFTDEGHRRHFDQWFTAEVDWPISRFVIQADEVEQIAWVTRAQFLLELKTDPRKYFPSAPRWAGMFVR